MSSPDTSHAQATVDMALWYSQVLRWHVLPLHSVVGSRCTCAKADCGSPGKHPLTQRGVYEASRDEAVILNWWQRRPWANAGIATGAVSGIVALDVDVDKGGDESLHRLQQEHGPLPDTPVSLTGGGGLHLIFAHPGSDVQNKVALAPGIDVRGDGGYIVAPPSLHASGRRYAWDLAQDPETTPLASLPGWLAQVAAKRQPIATLPGAGERITSGRNVALFRVAGALRRVGLDTDDIEALIGALNQRRCEPPLGAAEIAKIAASTARYEPAAPVFVTDAARLPLREVLRGA